jgi:hypothetical protein
MMYYILPSNRESEVEVASRKARSYLASGTRYRRIWASGMQIRSIPIYDRVSFTRRGAKVMTSMPLSALSARFAFRL